MAVGDRAAVNEQVVQPVQGLSSTAVPDPARPVAGLVDGVAEMPLSDHHPKEAS
jgi:hypothetical protein